MSVRNWLVLLVIYIANLFIGMALFHSVECPAELEERKERESLEVEVREKIHRLTVTLAREQSEEMEQILDHFKDFGIRISDPPSNTSDLCMKWDHQNSLFFAFTVVTTIGQ